MVVELNSKFCDAVFVTFHPVKSTSVVPLLYSSNHSPPGYVASS